MKLRIRRWSAHLIGRRRIAIRLAIGVLHGWPEQSVHSGGARQPASKSTTGFITYSFDGNANDSL